MWCHAVVVIVVATSCAQASRSVCNQKPPQATVAEPRENKGLYTLAFETKDSSDSYLPAQTYVLRLKANNDSRPFRWFMITVDDPDMDNAPDMMDQQDVDVGSLKTLDTDRTSMYSERCFNSVENTDNTVKTSVEVHWVSPKTSETDNQMIRLRAMVAENGEAWYIGEGLTVVLKKNLKKAKDTPPLSPKSRCNLCSEARYEVIFRGEWSRLTHPRHYPSKPDENGYSHMIGASHAYGFELWKQGQKASEGMQKLATDADISVLEREIIDRIAEKSGSRTLIRGRRNHHPEMSEPSHSLFRVDRFHHLFSLAVAIRPSPDWFLGTSNFELCDDNGWLEHYVMPLYPYDAGCMDGISYESPRTMTQPSGNIERVAVGSFDRESPFYQKNLNDLHPFATLEVNRLDVYPLVGVDCSDYEIVSVEDEGEAIYDEEEEPNEEPKLAESRKRENCFGDWDEWTPCMPHQGDCGAGKQARARTRNAEPRSFAYDEPIGQENNNSQDSCLEMDPQIETRNCFIEC